MSIEKQIEKLKGELPHNVTLVAVSKTHPVGDIIHAYNSGQRVFGESRPQELLEKYSLLPKDIRWHMIGHLQTNKVKYIASFIDLIHSVDSDRLLEIIDKEALKNNRVIDVLLEMHIADEESKHGWTQEVLHEWLSARKHDLYSNVRIRGLMGIATYTEDQEKIKQEFLKLNGLFTSLRERVFGKDFDILSMGMTSDYPLAIKCGSNMVRIGSLIFGERDYK